MLKSFPNEPMCPNIIKQGEFNPYYDLQSNKTKSYTFSKVEDPCVASIRLCIGDNLYVYVIKELLPCGVNDNTLLHDDNIIVVGAQTLVDPTNDLIDSSSKINLCLPSVRTYDLS